MYDAINEVMLEFALNCRDLMQAGWEFSEIKYGDRRLSIASYLTISKNDRKIDVYCVDDIRKILQEDING